MNIYDVVFERIMERINEAEDSGKPFYWVKPWNGGADRAYSYTTGKTYNGINQVLLPNGEYITYKALMDYKKKLPESEAEKIKIKKGAGKYPIFFYSKDSKEVDKKDKDGNPTGEKENKSYWFMKYYSAYNIEDIEGLPTHFPYTIYEHTATENTEKLEEYIKAYVKAENLDFHTVTGGGRCYYSPHLHGVCVPAKEGFTSLYGYYSSVLHELVHSTSKGLERDVSALFGSEKYSKEELVAEIGSQMLLSQFKILPEKEDEETNNISYIRSWAAHLQDHKTEIVKASCLAENAAEYFVKVAEKQLFKEHCEALKDIALSYKEGYLFVQEGASDYYDFSIFNGCLEVVDCGQIDKAEHVSSVLDAAADILNSMGYDISEASLYDDTGDFVEMVQNHSYQYAR